MFGLVVLSITAFWRTINLYFLSDDFVLLKHARSFHGAFRHLFTTGGGDGFFRPIGYVSLAFTWAFAGTSPVLWHAAALALHTMNVVLVFMLAIMLGRSRLAATFAAALFAVHGTRPEVAVWVAGRFDLLSTFFVLCGLLSFIRSQKELAPIGTMYAAASLACIVLAILSKESAYVFPLLLVLLVVLEGDWSWRRLAGLVSFFFMAAVLFAYRWILLGGIGGYQDVQTGQPQALSAGLVHTLKALFLRTWTILFFPVNWSREPNTVVAVLIIVYMLAVAWLATARVNRMALVFPLAFVLLTALPALPLLLIGSDLCKSRLLYLPSVGFCMLLAALMDGLRGRFRWIVPGVILVFHATALQHNLNSWEYASEKAKAVSVAAAKCAGTRTERIAARGLPGALQGVPFFANGFQEAVELQRNGGAKPVMAVMGGTASGGDGDSCVLVWDGKREELRVVH